MSKMDVKDILDKLAEDKDFQKESDSIVLDFQKLLYGVKYLDVSRDEASLGYLTITSRIDKLLEKFLNVCEITKKISCKDKCSHCCYSEIDISDFEADVIKHTSAKENINIDKKKLAAQSKVKWEHLPYETRRCVFLSDEGSCKIYKYRPLACRRHFVVSPSEFCNFESKNMRIKKVTPGFMADAANAFLCLYDISLGKQEIENMSVKLGRVINK